MFKFTHESSTTSISFLDTLVCKNNQDILYTNLYTKPTDSHMYLHYTSSHPKHCKTGLPYSQFLRLRRICSHDSDFTEHAKSMSQNFINRGYPPDLIHSSLTRAQNHDRQTLLSPKTIASQPQTKQPFFAISTFHPSFTAYKRTIQTNWDTLSRSLSTRRMFDTPITFGYRRPKNLREHLVHAKLPSIDAHDNRPKICPPKPCTKRRYCQTIDKSSSIIDPTSQRKYISRYNVTCQSQNLIYAIQCTKCQKLYVGQTKRRFQTRMSEHFRSITQEDHQKSVGHHFSTSNKHSGLSNVKTFILEFCSSAPSDQNRPKRERLEKKWQYRLHSHFPTGLNTEDEC